MSNNLRRFQWQIGEIVIGPNTQYEILGTNIGGYTVNAKDSQIPNSDTTTMSKDTRSAQPITFTIGVRDNAPMRNMPNSLPADLVDKASKLLGALQDEWFADDIKQQWGQYKPFYYCDGYGLTKVVWGRPGKFQYSPKTKTSQFRKVTAEFRRMDTLCYQETETFVELAEGADPVVYTIGGEQNAWFRVLFYGPMSNPVAVLGNSEIQLGMDIAAGVVVEVSSYPWSRRVIDSNNVAWRNKLIGATKYLDQLILPKKTPIPMSWSAAGTNADSRCLVLWHNTFNTI
ncbi:hypothetical protein [Mycobacterium sp. 1465703.0]|uniref:hypothetical protein n=1 Tax=Mycobacterium sp. 1465703.0 TaxID=1834078 RepID=UPI0007FFD4A4|nr:hypothetical protein [Mycobacterium sp. 1465703.0]OBJ03498.1 hypothetical protein A5625_22080 [Mycobacterium sp. 1465703.0]